MAMTEHAVVIAGGGPTGLMLAGELALAGVDVAIVERRITQDLPGSRAGGLHARTIELLDQRGIADRFVSQGQIHKFLFFYKLMLDISDLPSRRAYVLGLFQTRIERILAEWVEERGVTFYRGREVTGFTQADAGVDVVISDGSALRAKYLVGCDGGRSLVRKTAGIAFPGWDATTSWILAEVDTTEDPPIGMREDAAGSHGIGKADNGQARIVITERERRSGDEPTLDELREGLVGIYGTDFGVHNASFLSRFTDATRQAAAYRDRRVLLAGDAAHIHPPFGGQGLNIGVHDAVNLGWKLAQVVQRISSDTLLDSYHAERHPAGARVLRNTLAQSALRRTDDRTKAMGDLVAEFVRMDEPRQRIAAEISGLDVHYDLGEGHPLLGRRMPDLELTTASGAVHVYTLLHRARPVLINFGAPGSVDVAPWADRVQRVDATYDGAWDLPALGMVAAAEAVLVRPDGHVAWVGDATRAGLTDALTRWFGPPASL